MSMLKWSLIPCSSQTTSAAASRGPAAGRQLTSPSLPFISSLTLLSQHLRACCHLVTSYCLYCCKSSRLRSLNCSFAKMLAMAWQQGAPVWLGVRICVCMPVSSVNESLSHCYQNNAEWLKLCIILRSSNCLLSKLLTVALVSLNPLNYDAYL